MVQKDTTATFPIALHIIPGGTIRDGLEEAMQESIRQSSIRRKFFDMSQIKDVVDTNQAIVSKLVQLVLYICSENAEIDENPDQKKITRRPSTPDITKDKFREIRKWDVGIRTTRAIRSILSSDKYMHYNHADNDVRSGSPKRPHARCGHWHHFWTGKRDRSDRRLILKWVAPTFINTSKEDQDTPVVIREISDTL